MRDAGAKPMAIRNVLISDSAVDDVRVPTKKRLTSFIAMVQKVGSEKEISTNRDMELYTLP